MTKTKPFTVTHESILYTFIALAFICGAASPAFPCVKLYDLQDKVSVFEGEDAVFELQSCMPYNGIIRYRYTTVNGSAVSPDDYKKQTGTVSFWPGLKSAKVTVQTHNDSVCEAKEQFYLKLDNMEVWRPVPIPNTSVRFVPYDGHGVEDPPQATTFSAEVKQWRGSSLTNSQGQYWASSHSGCGSSGTFGE